MKTLLQLLSFIGELLFPLRDTGAVVRDLTPEAFGRLVAPRLTTLGYVGLLPYRHRVVRAVIIEAKFRKNAKAISLLAQVLRDYVEALAVDARPFSTSTYVVIPIPLSPKRLRERGYNQVEEVVKAAGLTGAPHLLARVRDTTPQTQLSKRERVMNMSNAFTAVGPFAPNVTYVLLDDVTTTGATLDAAVQVLKSANVQLIPLALAY
jgi:predicted amidophosphoribosyltransferase